MDAASLERQLRRAGVQAALISRHRHLWDVLNVHLHADAMPHQIDEARATIAALDDVIAVTDSLRIPTLLLVRVETDDPPATPR